MTAFTRSMRGVRWLIVIVGVVIGIGMMPLSRVFSDEEATAPPTTSRRTPTRHSTKKPASESHETPSDPMSRRLEEILDNQRTILANQQTILQKFDAVMEELRIIKVRASLRGGSS